MPLKDDRFSVGDSRVELLRSYIRCVDRIAEENADNSLWWATTLASKNRFTAPLEKIAVPEERPSVIRRTLHKVIWGYDRLRHAWRLICRSKHFKALFASRLPQDKAVYVIKSFSYPSSIREGSFVDPFFGELAGYIEESLPVGHEVLTVVNDFDLSGSSAKKLAEAEGRTAIPLEVFLSTTDIMEGLLTVFRAKLFSSFVVPDDLTLLGKSVGNEFRSFLNSQGGEISLHQLLHRAVARNLANKFAVSGCVITYEGNPWERMFVQGMKSVQPDVPVYGYQHSVVPQAAAGVFPGPKEISNGPMPDVVLTTGRIPAEIMCEYGFLSKRLVTPACALRNNYLYQLSPKKRASGQGPFTVLVTPEGVAGAIDLVAYALEQSRHCPKVKFRIRTHPLTPLSTFLEVLGVRLDEYDNVAESEVSDLVEDITHCDAVLYWGSTVALEALMIGTPLIHFDKGEMLSYDPLFQFTDFKWVVSSALPLASVVDDIESLSDHEYDQLAAAGREYVEAYFHPVNEQNMASFLPPGLSA